MSFEINPVLAGKFDAPDYVPAHNLAAPAAVSDTAAPDPRRYTKFDRSSIEAGSTTDFSFSDLVDLLNPLEHIPIVSSIYRSITGEQINPISRVAGDILYGGLLGGASAVLGGVGAIADAGLEAETGKDSGGLVLSALFGPDDQPGTTQLADAGSKTQAPDINQLPPSQTIDLAEVVAPAPFTAALQIAADAPVPVEAQTPPSSVPDAGTGVIANLASAPVSSAASSNTAAPGTIPLIAASSSSSKQPFGGVMKPPTTTQGEDLAVALSSGSPGMRMGHMIYTNRLMNGRHPLPPMLSSSAAAPAPSPAGTAAPAPAFAPPPVLPGASTSAVTPDPETLINSLASAQSAIFANAGAQSGAQKTSSPLLAQDMMLKMLSQYKNTAGGMPAPGNLVNLTN